MPFTVSLPQDGQVLSSGTLMTPSLEGNTPTAVLEGIGVRVV